MPVLPEIRHELEINDGVTVTVASKNNHTTVTGPKGTLERAFRFRGVEVTTEDGLAVVKCDLPRREQKAIAGTYAAHLRNMMKGVSEGWTYEMKIVYNHFPIKVKSEGATFVIENFLGERHPRKAAILPGVKINVNKDILVLEGIDREAVSQTAANIEQATRIRGRDIRVFQDGIYITSKGA